MALSGRFPVMTRFWLNVVASGSPDTTDREDDGDWGAEDWKR
jgi:hypothetical protein